jgi:hypothetical protein
MTLGFCKFGMFPFHHVIGWSSNRTYCSVYCGLCLLALALACCTHFNECFRLAWRVDSVGGEARQVQGSSVRVICPTSPPFKPQGQTQIIKYRFRSALWLMKPKCSSNIEIFSYIVDSRLSIAHFLL